MSRAIPAPARQLAAELERRFARDAELATQLNDAQQRLRDASDRLWSGLHPDGIAAIYGEHPAAIEGATAHNRSQVLDSPDPLRAVQQAHWTIHKAFINYEDAAERRRQLAAEVGELAGELIASLVAAGWSEHDAREANIPNLIRAGG
ncbi:MAG: hypothetical protein ACYCXW_06350 [Solirubrobacteraceae bacterium]